MEVQNKQRNQYKAGDDNSTKDITIRRNQYEVVNFSQGQVGVN